MIGNHYNKHCRHSDNKSQHIKTSDIKSTKGEINKMTNTGLLRRAIKERGVTIRFLAEKMGLTYYGLFKKIQNINEFKASEIMKLYKLLDISKKDVERIFFAS